MTLLNTVTTQFYLKLSNRLSHWFPLLRQLAMSPGLESEQLLK